MAIVVACVASVAVIAFAHGRQRDAGPPAMLHTTAFSWLHPDALPAAWSNWRLPASPARLPMPPGWRHEDGDPGTRTVVMRGPAGEIAGYLNATPRQGEETPGNWSRFRIDHNREEGDRDVRLLAAATGLRFREGTGSCVLDSYRTTVGGRYRELACIVSGRAASTVIVAAAPPARWGVEAPTLERAITAFTT